MLKLMNKVARIRSFFRRFNIFSLLIIGLAFSFLGSSAPAPYRSNLNSEFRHQEAGPVQIGEIEPENINISYLNNPRTVRTIHYPDASYIKIHFSQEYPLSLEY